MLQLRLLMFLMGSFSIMASLEACSTPPDPQVTDEDPATVEIDTAMHFLTPSGEDITILPDAYEVKGEEFGLRFIAEEGNSDESILLQASIQDHQETITRPATLLIADKVGNLTITLLRPNGKRWEVHGTLDHILSRAAERTSLSNTEITRQLENKRQAYLLLPQLVLSSVSLKYAGSNKSYKGKKRQSTWRLPVNDTLNSGSVSFTWGGFWEKGALKPSFIPSQVVDLQNLVKKKQCCIQLMIDGKATPLSRLKFGKRGTLLTRATLSNIRSQTWPKTVKVVISKGKKTWESSPTKIYAKPMSYYASVLHPIFSHERCTTCHALGDHDSIVEMHQYRLGIDGFPYQFDDDAKPHNPSFCETCHAAPNFENAWSSPFAAQGLNWKGWNAALVCQTVTGPFTNKDGKVEPPFDRKRFTQHFHQDPRVLWAVSDGITPSGKNLEVPFSKNPNAWFRRVDPWVEAGTPCPTKSQFFRRDTETERFYPRR